MPEPARSRKLGHDRKGVLAVHHCSPCLGASRISTDSELRPHQLQNGRDPWVSFRLLTELRHNEVYPPDLVCQVLPLILDARRSRLCRTVNRSECHPRGLDAADEIGLIAFQAIFIPTFTQRAHPTGIQPFEGLASEQSRPRLYRALGLVDLEYQIP